MIEQPDNQPFGPLRIKRVAWRDLAVSLGPVLLVSGLAIWVAVHFVRPAPPRTIVITSGPEGSVNHTNAERYRKILARNGITVEVLPSEGSLENLKRLVDPTSRVDVGFVQGGLSTAIDTTGLVSLGSVFYQPIVLFYRAAKPMDRLAELKGRRIA